MEDSKFPQYLWLLAILSACAAPLISHRVAQQTDSTKQQKQGESPVSPEAAKSDLEPKFNNELHALLRRSLAGKLPPNQIEDELDRLKLDFVVATVSDPLNSRLPVDFDQTVESLELAASRMGYHHDRFSFPWPRSKEAAKNRPSEPSESDDRLLYPEHTSFQGKPGIVLFRKPLPPDKPAKVEHHHADYIVLLLVGETSTTGIDSRAFQTALDWCTNHGKPSQNASQQDRNSQSAESSSDSPLTFRILGPRYSGSQESLQQAITAWFDANRDSLKKRQVHFDVISGTASAIEKGQFETWPGQAPLDEKQPLRASQLRITFSATCQKAEVLRQHLDQFVRDQLEGGLFGFFGQRTHKVAWLVEASTGFGVAADRAKDAAIEEKAIDKAKDQPKDQPNDQPIDKSDPIETEGTITFPLHISQVFQTYKKQGLFHDRISEISESFNQGIQLPADELDVATDVTPDYDGRMSAVTADLELARIMRAIANGDFDYVGIIATDVRDRIFLTQMISNHCPDVRLMTLYNDLSYLHPEVLPYTTGMLIATTYPLISRNQTWSFPHEGNKHQMSLASDPAIGVYNAFVLLLKSQVDDLNAVPAKTAVRRLHLNEAALLLEFGMPLDNDTFHSKRVAKEKDLHFAAPAAWVVMASQAGFVPVTSWKTPPPPTTEAGQDYVSQVKVNLATADRSLREANTTGLSLAADWVILTTLALLVLAAAIPVRQHRLGYAITVSRDFQALQGARVALLGSIAAFFLAPVARCFADYHRWPIDSRNRFYVLLVGGILTGLLPFAACALWWRLHRSGTQQTAPKASQGAATPVPSAGNSTIDLRPVYLGVALSLLLVISTIYCFVLENLDVGKPVFAIYRSVALFSGVSIAWPIVTLFAALATWLWDCEGRARLLSNQIVAWPFSRAASEPEASGNILAVFHKLDECRYAIDRRCHNGWAELWAQNRRWCMIILAVWLFFATLVSAQATPTHESWLIDCVIYVAAGILFWIAAVRCLAFTYLWKDLQRLLEWIAMLPIRSAFDRLPRGFGQQMGLYLDAERGRSRHEYFAATRADSVLATREGRPDEFAPGESSATRSVIVTKRRDPNKFSAARTERRLAALCTRIVSSLAKPNGLWSPEFAHHDWSPAPGDDHGDSLDSPPPSKQWQQCAEDLLAIQTVRYINQYLAYMRKLCVSTVALLLLLLFGVTAYPLQPQMGIAIGVLCLAGTAIVTVGRVLMQMNKDEIISRLNKTTPHEISWDKGFVTQMATLLGPFVLVLFVQIPGIGHFLRSMLDPVIRTLTVNH